MNSRIFAVLAFASMASLLPGTALAQHRGMGGGMMGGGMCAGGCRMMDITPEPVDPRSLPEPRSAGARLLTSRCTQCHGLVSPRQHAAQEWPGIVERMDRRMQMMARGMGMMRRSINPLSAAEKATLVAYLERNSFRALEPETMPEKRDPAAQAFLQTCSKCHAPPDPSLHSPQQWDGVVSRMAQHMEQQGFGPLAPEEKELVLSYLKKAH